NISFFRDVVEPLLLKKYIYILLFPLLFSFHSYCQETIEGVVVDTDGAPVPWVTVAITSTSLGTTTDLDGKFSITTDQALPITLAVSFMGYRTEEIDVYETKETIHITLTEDVNLLNEIVITGVAEGTSRKQLSFALTKIGNELIKTVPATDASLSLRGKV